jgi:hypothetical protein
MNILNIVKVIKRSKLWINKITSIQMFILKIFHYIIKDQWKIRYIAEITHIILTLEEVIHYVKYMMTSKVAIKTILNYSFVEEE